MPLSPSILCQIYRNKYLAMRFPNHDSIEFFPLNIINGSNAMLAALTTAKTVMFSRRALKDNLKALSPLTVIHFLLAFPSGFIDIIFAGGSSYFTPWH